MVQLLPERDPEESDKSAVTGGNPLFSVGSTSWQSTSTAPIEYKEMSL